MMNYLETIKKRRSIYNISKEIEISIEEIKEVIENAMLHTPTAFNMQSGRVILLLDQNHEELWEVVKGELRKIVPVEAFANTEAKINGFKAGKGTLLFFEDDEVVNGFATKFSLYADNFPIWASESNGALQNNIWNMLEEKGLGVSLQHYTPMLEVAVKTKWQTPENWRLVAQMPFGKKLKEADEKSFQDLASRFKIFE